MRAPQDHRRRQSPSKARAIRSSNFGTAFARLNEMKEASRVAPSCGRPSLQSFPTLASLPTHTTPSINVSDFFGNPHPEQTTFSTASVGPLDHTHPIKPCHRRPGPDGERPQSTASVADSVHLCASLPSALDEALINYKVYTASFDDHSSPMSCDIADREQESSDVDQEDIKDLSAVEHSRSIRENLGRLPRCTVGQYAYTADAYSDPNVHSRAKLANSPQEATSVESSHVAQLIPRLSSTHDRSVPIHNQISDHHGQDYRETAQPKTSSRKDSPLSASDAHEAEPRTPSEAVFGGPQSSVDDDGHESALRTFAQPSGQPPLSAQTPSCSSLQTVATAPHSSPLSHSPPARTQQFCRFRDRAVTQASSGSYDIDESCEVELLSDGVTSQRRAIGKAWAVPSHSEAETASASSHGHDPRKSSAYAFIDSKKPFTRFGPQDIAFSACTLPERQPAVADCIDVVMSCYPSICDAPPHGFDNDGRPLPPTKKQETSNEERQARREALCVTFCAKQPLSLIKAMVIVESRSASWKRIGPLDASTKLDRMDLERPQQGVSARLSNEVAHLPPMPSPWSLEIRHEQLDAAQIKSKTRKTMELSSLRTNAQCVKCDGSGLGACITCKAEHADECFWCCGTGREKIRAQARCRRCQGAGVLKCNTCHGSLKAQCGSCEGTGTGHYGFFVDVTVKRIEMPVVPISTLFPQLKSASTSFEPSCDTVKTVATLALWNSIIKLTEAQSGAVTSKGSKVKSREMVPIMAACVWEKSITHVVAVDVPLAAKFKKGASPALRPEGLHRKIPIKRRFFTVPNDEELRSVELTEDEVKKLGAPETGSGHMHHPHSTTTPASQPLTASGSHGSSPTTNSVDLCGLPPLPRPHRVVV